MGTVMERLGVYATLGFGAVINTVANHYDNLDRVRGVGNYANSGTSGDEQDDEFDIDHHDWYDRVRARFANTQNWVDARYKNFSEAVVVDQGSIYSDRTVFMRHVRRVQSENSPFQREGSHATFVNLKGIDSLQKLCVKENLHPKGCRVLYIKPGQIHAVLYLNYQEHRQIERRYV